MAKTLTDADKYKDLRDRVQKLIDKPTDTYLADGKFFGPSVTVDQLDTVLQAHDAASA